MGMFGNKAGMKQPLMADQRMALPQFPQQAPMGGGMFGSGRGANALGTISAILADIGGGNGPDMVLKLAAAKQQAAQQAQKQAAMQQLYGLFGGSAQGAGVGGGPNLRDPRVAQALLAAEGMGVDVGTALELMKAQRPQVQIGPDGTPYDQTDPASLQRRFRNPTAVANTVVDLNNPDNEGMVVPEAPVKGAMPVYDNRGRVVDWTMPQGALGSIQAATGAETAGRTGGTLYKVPRSDGSEAFMTGNQFLGGGGPSAGAPRMGGPQLGVTQSPADRAKAEALARGDAERANATQAKASTAASQLAALDTMEELLPDVIAGFGADKRLEIARALALAGNDKAKKQVAATETFINQGRVLVADIIKSFGSNPTEGERKFAERMSGADAQLNPETLKEGIRLQRARVNRNLRDAGRTQAGTVQIRPDRAALEAELRQRGLIP